VHARGRDVTARLSRVTPGIVNGNLLSVPWYLGDSTDSRGAFADLGEQDQVMTVFAKSHAVARYVTALHNAELARHEAALGGARARRERASASAYWRARHRVHALMHRQLHARNCSQCRKA
jgi:hypothetical protein